MKKRILMLILAAMLTLSATACGSKDEVAASAESNEVQAGEDAPEAEKEDVDAPKAEKEDVDAPEAEKEDADAPKAEKEDADASETEKEDVDAFATALENMKSVTNMEAQMTMEMNMNVSAEGESQSMESITKMDMAFFSEPRKIKAVMTVDMGELGSAEQSIYGEIAEDGTGMMYLYDGTSWQSAEVGTADLEQYDASSSMLSFIDNGSVYTQEGMEEVDGANAYKYSCVTSGEEARQMLLSSGATDSLSSLGVTADQLQNAIGDVGEITEYVWIDEATLYPVKYETDMTQAMSTLMAGIFESMGEQAQGVSMDISKMKITMTCSNFNNAADFTIPEEAKEK